MPIESQTERKDLNSSAIQHHHHHHHHHRKHGMDDAEAFKQHQFGEQRRWKLLKNITFYGMLILAILVVLAVFYVYTH